MRDTSLADAVTVKAETAIEPLTVSLATAARLLGVSDRHLRTLTKEGTVPFVKLGGRILFRVESLNRMLAEIEQANATPRISQAGRSSPTVTTNKKADAPTSAMRKETPWRR
jgi:excisionase family DNA binding protein